MIQHINAVHVTAGTSLGATIVSIASTSLPVIQWIAAFIGILAGIASLGLAWKRWK